MCWRCFLPARPVRGWSSICPGTGAHRGMRRTPSPACRRRALRAARFTRGCCRRTLDEWCRGAGTGDRSASDRGCGVRGEGELRWPESDVAGAQRVAGRPVQFFETRDEAVQRPAAGWAFGPGLACRCRCRRAQPADGWRVAQSPATFGVGVPDMAGLLANAQCPVVLARGGHDPMVTDSDLAALVPEHHHAARARAQRARRPGRSAGPGSSRRSRVGVLLAPEHLALAGIAGRVLCGQGVDRPVGALPLGHRASGSRRAGHEPGPSYELVAVDVARTVRIDGSRPDTDDELSLRILAGSGSSRSMLAVPSRRIRWPRSKSMNSMPTSGIDQDVAGGQVHAVAVVVREGQRVLDPARGRSPARRPCTSRSAAPRRRPSRGRTCRDPR